MKTLIDSILNIISPSLVGLYIMLLSVLTLLSLDIVPNPIFEDDAFFYWISALRTVESGFPTFDGYEPTNGFHWFWYMILTTSAFLADKLGFSTLTAKAFFLIVPSLLVWSIIFRKLYVGFMPLALITAFFVGFTMETSLAGLFLGIAYTELLKKRSPVIWLSLAILVRIDLVIAALVLVPLLNKRENLHLFFGILFAIASSLLVNYLLVGEFFTVSSQIKSLGASKTISGYLSTFVFNTSSYGNMYRYLLAMSLNSLAYYLYTKYFRTQIKFNAFTILLISANCFLIAHSFISSMRDWYFAPTIISLLVIVSFLLFKYEVDNIVKTWPYVLFVSILGSCLLIIYSFRFYPSWSSTKTFHTDACRVLENQRIFVHDGSGSLAWNLYHCGKVTNGDGLVNSHTYFREVVAKQQYIEYIKENNISFYITNNADIADNCLLKDVCVDPQNIKVLARAQSGSYFASYRLVQILDLKSL